MVVRSIVPSIRQSLKISHEMHAKNVPPIKFKTNDRISRLDLKSKIEFIMKTANSCYFGARQIEFSLTKTKLHFIDW